MRRLTLGSQEQRFAVADLTKGGVDTFAELARDREVCVVYSDPPWNPGNEKFWRTKAGVEPPAKYDDLLAAWVECVLVCDPEHVFVEQSVNPKHREMLLDAIDNFRPIAWRWPLLEEWTVQYGHPKRPNTLMHFGRTKLRTDPSGMSGESMTRRVFEGFDMPIGGWVADPCMGLGTTSRIAHEFGLSCLGTELNAARLERTIGNLVKLGYRE